MPPARSATKLAWSVLVFSALMPGAMSQMGVNRTAISTRQVADAMVAAGIVVNPDQIELLSGVGTARGHASMRVVSVMNGNAGIAKVKLRCRDNHECLPFYVLVRGLDEGKLGSARERPAPRANASALQNVIHGGDHATLFVETPNFRMTVPVICLQSGVHGQRIRVASLDRKRYYDAEVVAAGILKGNL